MGNHRLDQGTTSNDATRRPVHWTGLPTRSREIALFALVATVLVDLLLQFLAFRESGVDGLTGGQDLLGSWDLAKAIAAGGALLLAARRSQRHLLGAMGFVFVIIGIEDMIALHAVVGHALADLIRFDTWVPGVGVYGSHQLGEFISMGLFGAAAFVFVWARRSPYNRTLQRVRMILTLLLVAMFVFAGFVDLLASAEGELVPALAEEVGERLTLTLAMAYASGVAAVRNWWALP